MGVGQVFFYMNVHLCLMLATWVGGGLVSSTTLSLKSKKTHADKSEKTRRLAGNHLPGYAPPPEPCLLLSGLVLLFEPQTDLLASSSGFEELTNQ